MKAASASRWVGVCSLWLMACCTRNDERGGSGQTPRPPPRPTRAELPFEGQLPSLAPATAWINSPPWSVDKLRGKVVLVQFWTYSCINWRRTMPYVRAWSEKYASAGLVVIGVHSPEFDFERSLRNVEQGARATGVTFPIAVDSEHAIWNAFGNQYWPALYFVDGDGQIRHHQFGEGDYERAEQILQVMLAEAGARRVPADLVSGAATGAELAPAWDDLQSPELYLGYALTQNFASPGAIPELRRVYAQPASLSLNHWALAGAWTLGRRSVTLHRAGGKIVQRFHARDLHLVMGPSAGGTATRFRVRLDGQPPGEARGVDVDAEGNGILSEPRMYQLIRQPRPIVDRTFEIEFLDDSAEAFSFTFG